MAELEDKIKVDTAGTPVTTAFNIELFKVPVNSVDRIEIQATMTFVNQPSETVTFKKNGTWGFTPTTPTWLTIQDPVVVNGSDPNFRESVSFASSLTVSNQNVKVDFEVTTTDTSNNLLTDESFTVNVVTDFPIPASGIASEKKTTVHTFTDFDLLPQQTTNDKIFGPVSGAETIEYRTWCGFPTTTNALKAYAVTDGEFFIQEIPNSNPKLVNLVLKPDTQPDSRYGPVKYFVYRGLKRGSFLDSTPQEEVLADLPTNSDLLKRMWVVRNMLNSEANTPLEIIHRNDIGLDDSVNNNILPATELIEDIFDRYVFQRLTPGMWIGEFETSGDYGFQIILEGPNFRPTLADLRVLDHKVTVTSQFPTAEDNISVKLQREQILSYNDPVAYFGLLFDQKIEEHRSQAGGGNQTLNSPDTIYSEIVSKFDTKNRVYVDIRNELNNSLNFYGSYGNTNLTTKVAEVQVANASQSFNVTQYHTNGWPILILDTAIDFPSPSSSSDDKEMLSLILPDGDNDLPSLFLSGSGFFDDFPNYKDKFKILTSGDSFDLGIGNEKVTQVVFPFAVKIAYTRRYDIDNLLSIPTTLLRPWKDDYIDNLLSPSDINLPSINNSSVVQWDSLSELKYIGWTSFKGNDYTIRCGLAKDSIGEVAFAFIQGAAEKSGQTSTKDIHSHIILEKGQKANESFFIALRNELRLVRLSNVEINIGTITNPIIKKSIQVDSVNGNFSNDILAKSFDDVISLSYTSVERTQINVFLNTFLTNSSRYYITLNHELKNDANDRVYFIFELGVQGILYDQNNFSYQINRTGTGIIFYSVDGRNYFTENYTSALETILANISQEEFANPY